MENMDFWKSFGEWIAKAAERLSFPPYRSFHISQQDNPSVTLCVPKVLPHQGKVAREA